MAHLGRGLEALADLPGGAERQRRELGLQLALGQALIAAKGFAAPEMGRAYARARELCRELGDDVPELFPGSLRPLSSSTSSAGELTATLEAARELIRLAEERDERAARVTGHRILGAVLCMLGQFRGEPHQLEAGLALYDPERDRGSALVYALNSGVVCSFWLVHALLRSGYPEQARARLRRGARRRPRARSSLHAGLRPERRLHLPWRRPRGPGTCGTEAEALVSLATEQGFPIPAAGGHGRRAGGR